LAVIADILRQSFRALPDAMRIAFRVDRRPVGEFRRYLDQRLGNQDSNGIKVGAIGPKA